MKASGLLPPLLGALDALTGLDLSGNAFYGGLPSEWANSQFPLLLTMYLNDNSLTGSIPWRDTTIMPQMLLFRVDANQMSGSLPSNLTFPSLVVLRMNDNIFSGDLEAAFLGNIPKIQILSMQNNKFAGKLPEKWALAGEALAELYVYFFG